MEDRAYKEELLRLVAEKKIKHTAKYIKSATDEMLKKLRRIQTSRIGRSEQKSHGRTYYKIIQTYDEFGVGER